MPADSHLTAPTRFAEAGGIRYAYRRFGAGTGTPLVFLQHFRGGMDHWDPLVTDGLAAGRPVILFDNAGVAGSSGQTPDTFEALADAAAAFIEALGLPRTDVLGFSIGGVEAWAFAAPTKKSLAAYARATIRAAAATHPCPAVPQSDQAMMIGGAPARLLAMQCPPGSGFLVETAVTIHDGTAFVFASQNPSGAAADYRADCAAFRKFLAGIRFQP